MFCPLYGPLQKETPFADGRLSALTLCFLRVLAYDTWVVVALSAIEADDPKEELAVRDQGGTMSQGASTQDGPNQLSTQR